MSVKTVDQLMQQFWQFQNTGKLPEARYALKKILKVAPLHAEALHLLGTMHLKASEYEKGLECIRKAISLQPDFPEAHYNLGIALGKQQCYEEALDSYRRALVYKPNYWKACLRAAELLTLLQRPEEAMTQCLRALSIKPDSADAYFGIGVAHLALGRFEDAIAAYRNAISLNQWHVDAHNNLGFTLAAINRYDEALVEFRVAVSIDPNCLDAHVGAARVLVKLNRQEEAVAAYQIAYMAQQNAELAFELAQIFRESKRYPEAVEYFQRALQTKPHYFEALNGLGLALFELSRYEDAAAAFQQMLEMNPADMPALINLGNTYYELRMFEKANHCYEHVLQIDQDNVAALNGLGSVLVEINELDDAANCFNHALRLDPKYEPAIYNLGVALEREFRFDEALERYNQAIALKPDFVEACWNRGLVYLLKGQLGNGWPDYEFRRKLKGAPPLKEVTYPRWTGESDISGKKLLIQAEQGYGDAIQMVRYISLLEQRGVECWLQSHTALISLLQRSFPTAHVIDVETIPEGLDYYIPITSLPGAIGTITEGDIPRFENYLVPNPDRVSYWQQQFKTAFGRTVGLVWRGNPQHRNDHNRSASLTNFLMLIHDNPSILFITLQKDLTNEEQELLKGYPNVQVLDDELSDFDETASIISNLSEVISIDSAPAHLAGALGIPVSILLPFHGEWRWMVGRNDSPWYPSARLFRQTSFGNWPNAISEINIQLKQSGETSNA